MTNTNEDLQEESASPSKSGETGANGNAAGNSLTTQKASRDSKKKSKSSAQFPKRITDAIVDQRGQHWLKIEYRGQVVWATPHDFLSNAKGVQNRLAEIGAILEPGAAGNLAKEAAAKHTYRKSIVAYQPGWIEGHYAMADGTIISPPSQGLDLPTQFKPSPKFCVRGTVTDWVDAITPLVKSQQFSLFAISVPFLAPLLDVMQACGVDIQNPMFEVVGPSTRAKTTVSIKLAGSAIGFAQRHAGFGESWYTTKEGIVPLMQLHSDCFLGMDETNLASDDQASLGKLVAAAIHIIANGTSKTTKTEGVGNEVYRVVLMSTSNKSLLHAVNADPSSTDHLSARLISIIPPNSKLGVLSQIPPEFSDSGKFIEAMRGVATNYHGAPFRAFIERLVHERHRDAEGLVGMIKADIARFMRAVKITGDDPLQYRRSLPFGAAYAASRLARAWGVLPKKNAVGDYLIAFKTVWSWTHTPVPQPTKPADPLMQIREYVVGHKTQFADGAKKPRLSNAAFAQHPGILTKTAGRRELVLSSVHFDMVFRFNRVTKSQLRRMGVLAETSRNTVKRTVRRDEHGVVVRHERVVAICIDAL